MSDSDQREPRRYAFWREVVVPTAKGLQTFFWNLVWFLLIVYLLLHNELKGLWK